MYVYSDPCTCSEDKKDPDCREHNTYALPNIEVFYANDFTDENGELEEGFYWWACFPGCMPDGDPEGPFETEQEAIADAQDDF
jgi:hypothetical protein